MNGLRGYYFVNKMCGRFKIKGSNLYPQKDIFAA